MPGLRPDEHVATFCETDAEMADAAAAYLLSAIDQGGAGVAIVTPEHERHIERRFVGAGFDLAAARADGGYVVVDARAAIDQVTTRGWPDPAAFWRTISPVIQRAGQDGQRPVRVFGEMVSLLWQADEFSAAMDVEALWTELARQHRIALLCAYLGPGGLSPGGASLSGVISGVVPEGVRPDAADELALLVAAHSRIAVGP
ncbi:MAG TPA: MEDS domain-containing protein [Streptosporangiaceae bacterium]